MNRKPVSLFLLTLGVAGAIGAAAASAAAPPAGYAEAGAAASAERRPTIAAAARRAAVADPNLDGEVTRAEAARYYRTRFRLLDADRDGWISQAEFARTAIVRSVHAGGSFAPRPTREFESFDLDGSGSLTPEEFLRAALMTRIASVTGEVGGARETLFDRVDTDRDGALSRQELMAAGARDFEQSDADGDGTVTIWEFYGGTSL